MVDVPRIALAVGGGYLLGRTRKLKFAILVGGAITGRRLPTSPTELLRMGAKVVAGSPELTRLSEAVRGQLWVAGRNAAIAAAGYQMEALTARLNARLELLENPDGSLGPVITASEPTTATLAAAEPGAPAPAMTVPPITVSVPDNAPDDQVEVGRQPPIQSGPQAASNGQVIEGTSA
jgi:hypothetical protein